ncbi:MAG: zinc ribbon domain-containing protein [Lentisphaerae bacterium]|nr:zinc ribbon domain-containing protein [Lentisphaerota bacterium]
MKQNKNICPNCNATIEPDIKFCNSCGTRIGGLCPECNEPVIPGASACKSCGFNLKGKIKSDRGSEALPDGVKQIFSNREKRIAKQRARIARSRLPFAFFFFLLIAGALAFYYWWDIYGSNPEPDWELLAQNVRAEREVKFIEPELGTYVELRLKNGQIVSGILIEVGAERLLLDRDGKETGVPATGLDERTRYAYFKEYYIWKHIEYELKKEKLDWEKRVVFALKTNRLRKIYVKAHELLFGEIPEDVIKSKTKDSAFFDMLERQ